MITRKAFLRMSILTPVACLLTDALFIEPKWLVVREIIIGQKPTHKIVHFSDLHYKGDKAYLGKAIDTINELMPDFVCFTGDIVEDKAYLEEALSFMRQIRYPVFGVPGNHEYWSGASFPDIVRTLESTGGKWLTDQSAKSRDGAIQIAGVAGMDSVPPPNQETIPHILLTHYPAFVDKLHPRNFDLILAGHSHGGQVRIPLMGALIVPYGVGRYDKGLFQTGRGPLYVNPGIGYFNMRIRFCCQPEITLIHFQARPPESA